MKDKTKHQVAINFISDPLLWHDTISNQLLLSVPGREEGGERGGVDGDDDDAGFCIDIFDEGGRLRRLGSFNT